MYKIIHTDLTLKSRTVGANRRSKVIRKIKNERESGLMVGQELLQNGEWIKPNTFEFIFVFT